MKYESDKKEITFLLYCWVGGKKKQKKKGKPVVSYKFSSCLSLPNQITLDDPNLMFSKKLIYVSQDSRGKFILHQIQSRDELKILTNSNFISINPILKRSFEITNFDNIKMFKLLMNYISTTRT